MSAGQTTVYQAKAPDNGQHLAQTLGDATAKRPGSQPAASVPGQPQSRCVRLVDSGGLISRYWRIATVDRYAFKAVARHLENAQQQVAAQYRILTN